VSAGAALMTGAILVVSGPTVIAPLLRFIRPTERLRRVLAWEGSLIDPVGGSTSSASRSGALAWNWSRGSCWLWPPPAARNSRASPRCSCSQMRTTSTPWPPPNWRAGEGRVYRLGARRPSHGVVAPYTGGQIMFGPSLTR
jgi:hypothetical protein